jgi:hypothetical protein
MLKLQNVIALKGFVKHLKSRLASMHEEAAAGGYCGKLVRRNLYGKVEATRCYGDNTNGRCYICDYTGIDCAGGCGGDVLKEGDFCSWSCRGQYYKDTGDSRYYGR